MKKFQTAASRCKRKPAKFKSRDKRAAHYRNLSHRTDKTARRGRAALDREAKRMELGPLMPALPSQPDAHQAGR